jgi:hypothetical protein
VLRHQDLEFAIHRDLSKERVVMVLTGGIFGPLPPRARRGVMRYGGPEGTRRVITLIDGGRRYGPTEGVEPGPAGLVGPADRGYTDGS